MAFFVNIGYGFRLPPSVSPDGSVVLASAMPMHQLERRESEKKYPHLKHRLFDPQLYLAGLDVAATPNHCAKLATYPWFGIKGLPKYSSGKHTQAEWTEAAKDKIVSLWPAAPPTDPTIIADSVRDCVDFQHRTGCEGVILPGPLTSDPGTTYAAELAWLDAGLAYCSSVEGFDLPVYATVALTDVCVRYSDPLANGLLDLILDSVSAREVQGVYIVLEQASEAADTRQCGNTRALWSILRLVHEFANEAHLKVGVNFLGAFGLACEAAGATWWASNWYKSLYRLRLADKLAGGRAYPLYWSYPAAIDVHMESDFDRLVAKGLLAGVQDNTSAAEALLRAASQRQLASRVPKWRYQQGNVGQVIEHYLLSMIAAEQHHATVSGTDRIDYAEAWLNDARSLVQKVAAALGASRKTKTDHVLAWRDAFSAYRRDHKV